MRPLNWFAALIGMIMFLFAAMLAWDAWLAEHDRETVSSWFASTARAQPLTTHLLVAVTFLLLGAILAHLLS